MRAADGAGWILFPQHVHLHFKGEERACQVLLLPINTAKLGDLGKSISSVPTSPLLVAITCL